MKTENYSKVHKLKQSRGLFKHTHAFTGYHEGYPYFTISKGPVDNIGRQHANVYAICDICNKKVRIGIVHLDENGNAF